VETSSDIRHIVEGPVATITLDRPAKHNAMTYAMRSDLRSLFRTYDSDPQIRVIVLTASGPSFCAGRDIREQVETNRAAADGLDDDITQFGLPPTRKVVVTAARGNALGLGAYLFLAGDIRIAGSSVRFSFPEVPTGVLGPYWLESTEHLSRATAFRLAVLGETVGAADLSAFGIVTEVVADDEVAAATDRWIQRVLALPPQHVQASKELLDHNRFQMTPDNRARETAVRKRLDALDDTQEAAAAFVEKRPATFTGR